jgi:leucyl aminopeptidase
MRMAASPLHLSSFSSIELRLLMDIQWQASSDMTTLVEHETDCLVLGLSDKEPLQASLPKALDQATGGLLQRLEQSGELPRKAGETLLLHAPAGTGARRLLLAGLGVAERADAAHSFLTSARAAATAFVASKAATGLWSLADTTAHDCPLDQALALSVRALHEADYRFEHFRPSVETPAPARCVMLFATAADEQARRSVQVAIATARGVALTRDLGNMPANVCTPNYLAEQARALGNEWNMAVEVFAGAELEALGLHAFQAVARGSAEPPRLMVVSHRGGTAEQAPVVLVGKGVTFDAGGISIKPSAAMDEMKYDMCGAASVLGAMRACAELALPINVVGVIAACENMPGGHAQRPGDVIRSHAGKTIEVLDTDAEGRLLLCDALSYVQKILEPDTIIDVATLTGSVIVALGSVHSGLFANDDPLAEALLHAGKQTGDSAWRMPLDEAYQAQLKSTVADMTNLGGRGGGSITAACFLSRFIGDVPWAHLDIAGTAWTSGATKDGTGRPVPLLVRYLVDRAA